MTSAPINSWVHEPLSPEVAKALQRIARWPDVLRVCAMPDVHLARDVCVGAVVATAATLYPAAVGGDIGCGMLAQPLDVPADRLDDEATAQTILAELRDAVPVLRHRRGRQSLPDSLSPSALSHPRLAAKAAQVGAEQLGTLGRGNHFVELQEDEGGMLWLMLHSGSRGIGQAIRDYHSRGRARDGLAASSPEGQAYLADQSWALSYARESRRLMAERIVQALSIRLDCKPSQTALVDCHHNMVVQETHEGRALWVHRKGAIRAGPGEPGIIPGSMGTQSYLVEGRGCATSLCSSSHGAGRAMSRAEARHRIPLRAFEADMQGIWFPRGSPRRLLDEAPGAYKDITKVMRAQRSLTKIRTRLRPRLVYKGL